MGYHVGMLNLRFDLIEWSQDAFVDYGGRTAVMEMLAPVTYDVLEEISVLFGTRDIDVTTETKHTGGCETCDLEYEDATIVVRNVTRWPISY